MTESTVALLLLLPFFGLLALDVYFWFWKTRESSFAPVMFLVAIPIATNSLGWPLGFRWAFPFLVFFANTGFSIWVRRKGWRGIMARSRERNEAA